LYIYNNPASRLPALKKVLGVAHHKVSLWGEKFVNIIEELGDLGSYECFSEDTFSFTDALEFLRNEKE